MDDLTIPAFLKIDAETRRKAWIGRPVTNSYTGVNEDAWRQREHERRRAIAEEIRLKKAASLAKLKEQHAGERYDRKLKQWVKHES